MPPPICSAAPSRPALPPHRWVMTVATLAAQAGGPPLNPVEMGSASFEEICGRLAQDQAFVAKFKAVYPEGLSEATITDAIAEYEKTLITPNSPFDRYLKGEKDAMTAVAKDLGVSKRDIYKQLKTGVD